jgi:hypothetical protein
MESLNDANESVVGSSVTKVKGKYKLPKIPIKLLVQVVAQVCVSSPVKLLPTQANPIQW